MITFDLCVFRHIHCESLIKFKNVSKNVFHSLMFAYMVDTDIVKGRSRECLQSPNHVMNYPIQP